MACGRCGAGQWLAAGRLPQRFGLGLPLLDGWGHR